MDINLTELKGLVGAVVVAEYASPSGEMVKSDGKLVRAAAHGVVFEANGKTSIIPITSIISIVPFTTPRKVVRRKVQFLLSRRARQHLLDRHGFFWDLIKFTTEETAFTMHQNIDHKNLGHQHRAQGDTRPDEEEELG